MKKVSIIIPVYNEVHTIDEILHRVTEVQLPDWNKQVIVVDDGSTDGTKKKLVAWEKKVTVVYKQKNEGKGSAVTIGLTKAKGDYILFQDADLEYDPKDYLVLLAPFENKQVDIVYGSRFLGPHLSTMFVYAQGNKFVTLVNNILYNANITDLETGFKAFRKEVLSGITVQSKRFDMEPEITAKVLKKGYQIYEVPISYYGRKFSEGKKLTWRDGIIAFWTLIKYRF
ncbi:MAG: glycosyltransferase family 2 protein [Microgenomates group bacterium]